MRLLAIVGALALMSCGTQFGAYGVYGSMDDKGRILIEIDPQVASCAALGLVGASGIDYCQ